MARTPDREPPEPAVQRLRVRFAKRGRLRFASHRDFQRALERALRRAAVPVAYSAGFSPHPRVSYLGAAATGTASEAEYLELAVTRRCDPAALAAALNGALPAGLDVVEAVEAGPGSLADRLAVSDWEVRLPGVPPAEAQRAVDRFLTEEHVPVERRLKEGRRELDARAPVLAAVVAGAGDCAILRLVVRHTTPAVRPDDVLTGLRRVAALAPPVPPAVTRLAQGPLDESVAPGQIADPLAPDRAAAAEATGAATGAAVAAAPGC